MTWFVASIVSCIELVHEEQPDFPVYEDFYLFEANSEEELGTKIRQKMKVIDDAGECNLDGKPARQRCVGVRKIRSVYNEPPLDIDGDQPGDGTDLTHSFFIAKNIHDVKRYAEGKAVWLNCVDDDPEVEDAKS